MYQQEVQFYQRLEDALRSKAGAGLFRTTPPGCHLSVGKAVMNVEPAGRNITVIASKIVEPGSKPKTRELFAMTFEKVEGDEMHLKQTGKKYLPEDAAEMIWRQLFQSQT